eukprot:SM000080S22936  [mRNA]  locus=s80:278202:280899:- [translate_table: standard]
MEDSGGGADAKAAGTLDGSKEGTMQSYQEWQAAMQAYYKSAPHAAAGGYYGAPHHHYMGWGTQPMPPYGQPPPYGTPPYGYYPHLGMPPPPSSYGYGLPPAPEGGGGVSSIAGGGGSNGGGGGGSGGGQRLKGVENGDVTPPDGMTPYGSAPGGLANAVAGSLRDSGSEGSSGSDPVGTSGRDRGGGTHMGGDMGIMPYQDEREVKRQRRKQSNRESARRSRLRKQAECEDLSQRVNSMSSDNSALRMELSKLQDRCAQLVAERDALYEQAKKAGLDLGAGSGVGKGASPAAVSVPPSVGSSAAAGAASSQKAGVNGLDKKAISAEALLAEIKVETEEKVAEAVKQAMVAANGGTTSAVAQAGASEWMKPTEAPAAVA